MKKQIYKMNLSTESAGYEIPEGWQLDKFLDVNADYVIMVLNKIQTRAEIQADYDTHTNMVSNSQHLDGYTTAVGTTHTTRVIPGYIR